MAKSLDELLAERTYLDSRDIQARFDELEFQRNSGADDEDDDALDEAEIEEFKELTALCEEGSDNFSDWPHGETLVPEHEFVEYAQELAESIGAINREANWPLTHIDWDGAAEALKGDYTSITIRGTEYWGRA